MPSAPVSPGYIYYVYLNGRQMSAAPSTMHAAARTPGFRRLRMLPGRIRAEITGLRDNPSLSRRIERVFRRQPGVWQIEANPVTGRVLVLYDPAATGPQRLLELLGSLESFQRVRAAPRTPEHLEPLIPRSPKGRAHLLGRSLTPLVSAGILVGVAIKVALFGHDPRARSERLGALSVFLSALTGYPQLHGLAKTIFGPMRPQLPLSVVEDYAAIATKGVRESLLGLSATAASQLLGVLEESAHWRGRRCSEQTLHPAGRARLQLGDGRETTIPVSELQPGEVVRLRAGDPVPADGVIEEGAALVDERVVGGSAVPARKGPGDHVYLGARLEQGSLLARIVATGSGTRMGRLLRRVPPARGRALPRNVERAIRRMSAAGIALACGTLVFTWSWRRALAVLAASNPSTLGHAAQATSGAAAEAAAEAGIRVLHRGALDPLARVDVVLFSAAALTAPSPAVDAVLPVGGVRAETVLRLAASVLRASAHPLGVPLLEKAREMGLDVPEASAVDEVLAVGVRGRVDGAELLVGEAPFMTGHGVPLDAASGAALGARGSEVLFVARKRRLLGVIGVRGRLLPGAREAVQGLRAAGVAELGVLGAGPAVPASRLAADLGVGRAWESLGPNGKLALVRRLRRRGHVVAVIGASAGDMLAMAHADVAIGLDGPGWTPLARVSHAILPKDRLDLLPGLLSLSRKVACAHRQHIAVAGAVSTLVLQPHFTSDPL